MKLLSLFSIVVLLLISTQSYSQVTDMGGPLTWKDKIPAATVPLEIMPSFDLALQLYEDSITNSLKGGPWRFGFNHYVDFNLGNSGVWTTLPNGDRIWRINIASKGALTINLIFEEFDLPEGAYVYLSDKDQSNRVGAYTSRNNNPEQKLGTELVHGDNIIVEYFEPQEVIGQGVLKIGTVTHGYKELGSYADKLGNDLIEKALNESGDCNVDVNCPLGNGWEDQIRSVAMIVVGGNGICSGALINNVSCDFTPYFLTANHCYSGSIATWSFRFNWESPPGTESCATTANSVDPGAPYDQTTNGGTVRANDSGSDFLLLEMNMSVAEAQSWNVFFAGWDNSETTPTQVTGIHHPSGDVKKICQDNGAVFDTWNFNGDPNTLVWRVNDWTEGVTEPGSSGSPLFDQNGRIIGDLSGGTAACSGTSAAGYDGYGRFGISWNGGGTPATRVRDWLDPANTSTTNDGCDPNAPTGPDDIGINAIITPDGTICSASFDPEVTLRNYGNNLITSATITYDIDGGAAQIYNWTGNLAVGTSVNVILPTMISTNGAHTFNATSSLPNGNADSDVANDGSSNPFFLVVGGESIDFTLDLDCWGNEITWTVQQGASVLFSGGPYTEVTPGGAGQITETWCLSAGCYDFTINDTYGDGLYGSQYGSCDVDGTYSIDQGATQLATIVAANGDFVNQEINNFCVTSSSVTADFSGTPTAMCPGTSVTFTDLSTGSPTSWLWTFPGGTPATSTAQNPTIVYNTVGTYDVTLQATGSVSDTELKIDYIVVADAIAPSAVCQNINVYLDGAGNASIVAADIDGGSTDNCGAVTLAASQTAFTCADIGANNVTLTVTDGNANSDNCVAVVTVIDTISPTAVCQNINAYLDGAGNTTIVAADIDGGSTDNCGIVILSASTTAFTCANMGANSVTLTVFDGNGNTSSCIAVVTVIDTISPTAVCQNINAYLDGAGNVSIVAADIDGGSSDNCGAVNLSASITSFTCADLGANSVSLTVDDGNGNNSSCTAIVTIIDTISPSAVCQNINAYLDGAGNTTIVAADIDGGSTDNCGTVILSASVTAFTCADVGPNNVSLSVDDGNGNTSSCIAVITVLDTISPVITCPGNQTENPDAFCNFTLPNYTSLVSATDNCSSSLLISQSPTAGTVISGSTIITMTNSDGNGNSSSCTFNVILNDVVAPNAVCQNVNVYLDGAGNTSITDSDLDGGSTDNCSGLTFNAAQTAFTCADLGVNNVTLTVTDGNSNSTNCIAVVTVIDTISPILPTLAIVTGECSATAATATTTDNCSGTITGTTTDPLTYSAQGTYTINWTFDDGNGNSITVPQSVIVDDITNPVTPTLANVTGECSATATASTTTDNCAGTITGTTTDPLTYSSEGTYTINWTFDDGNGNSINVPQTVIVDDITNPVTPTLANVTGECSATATASTTTDNCSGTITGTTTDPLTYSNEGTYTINWTFDDGNGNSISVPQTVIVDDITNPVTPSLANVTDECSVTAIAPTTTDNCEGTITGTTTDPLTYTSEGTYTINWTFDDGNGNSITVPQTVIVDDITNPVTPSLANVTDECSATAIAPTTTDNCAGTITGTTTDPLTYTSEGTYTINWTFDDGNGNSISIPQTVIVDDITNPAIPSLANVTGECSATATTPTTTDNCAGTLTGTTTDPLTYSSEGTYTINWTFDDGNGNSISVPQTVIVSGIDVTTSLDVTGVIISSNNTTATSYQWINCSDDSPIDGETNIDFTATVNGDYAVIVNNGSCTDTSNCVAVNSVGVDDIIFEDFVIYPNPTTDGKFTISYEGEIKKIDVVDMLGRIISLPVNLDTNIIDGSELATGNYMVRLYTESNTILQQEVVVIK